MVPNHVMEVNVTSQLHFFSDKWATKDHIEKKEVASTVLQALILVGV